MLKRYQLAQNILHDNERIGSGMNIKCAAKPIVILMGMQKNMGQTSQLGIKS